MVKESINVTTENRRRLSRSDFLDEGEGLIPRPSFLTGFIHGIGKYKTSPTAKIAVSYRRRRFSWKLFFIIIISCLFLSAKTSDAQENQEDISKTQTELKRQLVSLEEKISALEKENATLELMLSTQTVALRRPELIKADEENLDRVIHLNLGFAYGLKGQIKEAIVEYEMALRYDPDDKDVHYNLGYLLSKDNKDRQAIEEYKKALTGSPKDREVYYNLSIIYAIALKDYMAAQEYYQKFLTVPLTQTHLVPSQKEPIQKK